MRKRRLGRRSLPILALVLAGMLVGACTDAQAQFGVASLSGAFATTQAGAHSDFSTSLTLNRDPLGNPEGQLKTATFTLPAGSVGNPQAIERCSVEMLEQLDCARASQVGELSLTAVRCPGVVSQLQAATEAGATRLELSDAQAFCTEEGTDVITVGTGSAAETVTIASIVNATTLELAAPMGHSHQAGEDVTHVADVDSEAFPLYNVQPGAGHVAAFAATLFLAGVFIDVDVGENGRLTATIADTSTVLQLVSSTVTLWGVPAAASHDAQRCNELFECGPSGAEPAPFMTNPTSCSEAPEEAVTATSWQGQSATSVAQLPSLTGCEQLSMSPSLAVAPSTTRQDSPAGYELVLRVPQNEGPDGLATPALERVSVTLPQGTSLSLGLANGLQACEPAQLSENVCPDASRVGTAEATTPLLSEALKGSIYIGTPTASERYRLFLRVSADNAVIELRGDVQANEETGQTTTVFDDVPQLPLTTLKVDFFGGPAAALANGMSCGAATSSASLASYGGQVASVSSTFAIDEASEGGACPSRTPFAPRIIAGTASAQAGQSSPLTLSISRTDDEQFLAGFTAHLPPGLIGLVGSVPRCLEPAAASGECAQASQIGTVTVAAGAGPLPLYVSGPVYLTGPYGGAPFGLDIAIDAAVGPFDLGTVLVRSRIIVNPTSLALTIASDPLPQIVGGVPLRLRSIEIDLDHSGFLVNPTDCTRQAISATIDSSEGASVPASLPYQVIGCASLPFAPHLHASTQAKASPEGNGASLDVTVANSAGARAAIRSVSVELPGQLRPRLTAIQHACLAREQSPSLASCAPQSRVGVATVSTPVTAASLSGPIYLVTRGDTELPSMVLLLRGEGLEVELEGKLSVSSKDAITAAFKSLPDIPISSFALALRRGRESLLGARTTLCGKRLGLAYTFSDATGAEVRGAAPVDVSGCARHAGGAHRPSSRRRRSGDRART
jgi:hypothetical protein